MSMSAPALTRGRIQMSVRGTLDMWRSIGCATGQCRSAPPLTIIQTRWRSPLRRLTLPSRGCPKGCAFCAPLMSNVRRQRTHLYTHGLYQVKEIHMPQKSSNHKATSVVYDATTRAVLVDRSKNSVLMKGDPDIEKYQNSALPKLLQEGWKVQSVTGTTAVSGSASVPDPVFMVILTK
jgi:hypothetical protein